MYVIGTAGHVDHGKSLLVEALTGIDPDRLREEKQRGMTIDLGFAWLTLPSGRSVSIVDVPGHERFIKNMLAGAGGIDLALLVVAADDGVMPQTREHLAILDLIGVDHGVVALTKCDLADDGWLDLVEVEIVEALTATTLAGSPVVRCSALDGRGLDALRLALDAAIGALPPKRDLGRPRLPIDRVFTIGGFGTVVTGTLIDGALTPGMEVEALPGGLRGRIRGLQSHRDTVERALPGTRTAANIAGIARDELRRGLVLAVPGTLRPTDVLDVRVRAVAGLPHALRHNSALMLHVHADEVPAKLRLLDADELRAGGEAWAQLKLARPVAVVRGDRFVLRTPDDTVAGGVIADIAPRRHRRRHAPTFTALATMLSESPGEMVLAAVVARPFVTRQQLAAVLPLDLETIDAALASLVAGGSVAPLGEGSEPWLATPLALAEYEGDAVAALTAYHREHSLRAGMPQEELRGRLGLDARVFALLASRWAGVRPVGALLAVVDFVAAPSAAQRAAIDGAVAALRSEPYHPPALTLEAELLAYLVERGDVVDAGDGVIFDAGAFDEMRDAVRAHLQEHGTVTLAQVRDLFGTSRKYAQALLEHLDRLRVTRRHGDERVLR